MLQNLDEDLRMIILSLHSNFKSLTSNLHGPFVHNSYNTIDDIGAKTKIFIRLCNFIVGDKVFKVIPVCK